MRTRMYGGVRGRKTKIGRKLSFSSYSIIAFLIVYSPLELNHFCSPCVCYRGKDIYGYLSAKQGRAIVCKIISTPDG